MYLIAHANQTQGANVVFLSDAELCTLREIVHRANEEQPDWMGNNDKHNVHNANQILNVEN